MKPVVGRKALVALYVVLIGALIAACGTPATLVPTKAPTQVVKAPEPTKAQPTPQPTAQPTAQPKPTQAPTAAKKPVIIMALDSDLDNLEPGVYKTDSSYYLTLNTYQTVLNEMNEPADPEGRLLLGTFKFEGDAAESLIYSSDHKTATFKIRKGLKFSNGSPVNARTIKYTYDRGISGPGIMATLMQMGGVMSKDDIRVLDDYTLEVRAEKWTPMFEPLFAFASTGLLDQAYTAEHATASDPRASTWYKSNIMGSGPYVLKEWKAGDHWLAEPNPNYWRSPDFFKNSGIMVKIVPSPQDRLLLLKSGAIDLALGIPFKDIDALQKDPNVKVLEIPYSGMTYLAWNNKIKPFDDVRVRRALMYAIPYDTILKKAVYGHGRLARSVIPSDWVTSDQKYSPYVYNPEKAKALLKEAGVTGFNVELAVKLSIPEQVEAATWIQSAFAEVGVNVTVNKMTDAEYMDKLNKKQLPLFIHDFYAWLHDPFYQFNWLARSTGMLNYASYSNPEFDKLFEAGMYEPDQKKREQISVQMQHLWLDDAAWAPLYHPNWVVATGPTVKGFVFPFSRMLIFAPLTK